MGVAPSRVGDIPEGEFVQLLTAHAPQRMEGDENGPCEQQADATDHSEHLEISEEEKSIERRAIEDLDIWRLPEWDHPIKPSGRQLLRAFTIEISSLNFDDSF
jgi:hypothetical protein